MGAIRREIVQPISELPIALRHAAIGALVLGGAGGIAGLIIGLHAYAPTAVVAIVELGLPAALVGATLGLVSGSLVFAFRQARRH
jgi:hypothetical protein